MADKSFWQEPDPGGTTVTKQQKDKGAQDFIESLRDEIRSNMSSMQPADMTRHVTPTFLGDEFDLEVFELCKVCNLPVIFFHELNPTLRCKASTKYNAADVEDALIPNLSMVPVTSRFLRMIKGEFLRDHKLKLSAKANTRVTSTNSNRNTNAVQPTYKPKMLDAPQWSKDQHLNFYLQSLKTWFKINDAQSVDELLYALCLALEKSDKSDTADLIRVRFSNVDLSSDYDPDGLFTEIDTFLIGKYGKTRREEIEYYYNSFKTPRSDDQTVLSTILRLEADLQGLKNFSVNLDERLATIQLTQNCRLSQNELIGLSL